MLDEIADIAKSRLLKRIVISRRSCRIKVCSVLQVHHYLKNAPGTFQQVIDVLLTKVKWQLPLLYLEDLLIFWLPKNEHMDYIRPVLMLLFGAELTFNVKKCGYFINCLDYLGYPICPRRLDISTGPFGPICGLEHPTTVVELQSFLGMHIVIYGLTQNFARVATLLSEKLHKVQLQNFDWLVHDMKKSLDSLKLKLLEPPYQNVHVCEVPAMWKPTAATSSLDVPFSRNYLTVRTEQLDVGSFFSAAERAYDDTIHRKCLPVMWAVFLLQSYSGFYI